MSCSPLHLLINSTVESTTVTLSSQLGVLKGKSSLMRITDSYWLSSFIPPELGAVILLTNWNDFLSFFLCLHGSHLLSFPLMRCPRHGASIKLNCQVWLSLCFLSLGHFSTSRVKSSVALPDVLMCFFCKASEFDWNDCTLSQSTSLPLLLSPHGWIYWLSRLM